MAGGVNRPKDSAFRQQRLKAWQPILKPGCVIPTFLITGVVFLVVGAGLYVTARDTLEYSVMYDSGEADSPCSVPSNCTVTLTVEADMPGPVYVYYQLDNFYQNHRRYIASRSDAQLRGEDVSRNDVDNCEPLASDPDDSTDPADIYYPCGLIANSWFNDTFTLLDESNSTVAWSKDGIAWPSDVEEKYSAKTQTVEETGKRLPGWTNHGPGQDIVETSAGEFQWNEEMIVWMRVAGLPSFRKLHRRIEGTLSKGSYSVDVSNTFPVAAFEGRKSFVVSTATFMGGKNEFLGQAYIVVGAVAVVVGMFFLARHLIRPRKMGDQSYIVWN